MKDNCPLCEHDKVVDYHQDKKRPYLQCFNCQLVFVPKKHHLTPELEKEEYDKHENDLNDEGYIRFLSRAINPLLNELKELHSTELQGLDFGCGPAPALAQQVEKNGYKMDVYDPYFYPEPQTLNQQYDFVTCTEVVEHFNEPKKSLEQLFSLLKPNAILVFMTKLVIDQERFKQWHYKNDPTHISFFSRYTFEYLISSFNNSYRRFSLSFVDNDVIIIKKRSN